MTKEEKYTACFREIDIRLEKGGHLIPDLGNIAAVLRKRMRFFWIGFYLVEGDRLILGPFQGNPACVYIPFGQGVCGTCAETGKTIMVDDVHDFPGHIACDPDSKSEIVVPLRDSSGKLRAVMDADSDREKGFDQTDRTCLEKLARKMEPMWDSDSIFRGPEEGSGSR